MRLVAEAQTPMGSVQALAAHVDALAAELQKRQPRVFTKSPHADLGTSGGSG